MSRYVPASSSRASSRMRPSASVTPLATDLPSRWSSMRTPAAGFPVVVSRTWVESEAFAIGGVSYARCADGSDHRGEVHVQGATRRRARAEDGRRDQKAAAHEEQAGPRAVERRGHVGADG